MELKDRLATKIRDESYGGLLLCGMNWGGAPSNSNEGGWADFFADDATNKDIYQPRIKEWFKAWGFPLAPNGQPTILDLATSQTNLFLDQSKSFAEIGRSENDWITALNLLADTIQSLQISAVLILSSTLVRDVDWYARRCEVKLWHHVMGKNLDWTDKKHGRLKLRFVNKSLVSTANICHPRSCPTAHDLSSSFSDMNSCVLPR